MRAAIEFRTLVPQNHPETLDVDRLVTTVPAFPVTRLLARMEHSMTLDLGLGTRQF
jgi:hypothetical protein